MVVTPVVTGAALTLAPGPPPPNLILYNSNVHTGLTGGFQDAVAIRAIGLRSPARAITCGSSRAVLTIVGGGIVHAALTER